MHRPLTLALLLAACGGGGPDADAGAGVDASPDAGPSGRDAAVVGDPDSGRGPAEDGGTPEDAGRGDPAEAPDPGPPDFPSTISVLSFSARTGEGRFDGTDDNALSLCLSETDCFRMNVADVNDFRLGEIDVYHFEDVDLPRAAVDRVEIRSARGVDAWRPSCLEIRFDGEPVYCETDIAGGAFFGNDAGEIESWVDPAGLHEACRTCYPRELTHGPMLGAVESTRARVLVRTEATRPVALRVARGDSLDGAPTVSWVYPSPRRDFTGVLEVSGLAPDTDYVYGVEVDGARLAGPLPLRTARAPGAPGALRFAFGSCTRSDDQPIFSAVLDAEPDLFLFLGDNHYANSGDLGGLRWFYRWALERPERAAMLARVPTLATWDDHDYTGNNTDATAPGKDVALRVFAEYWANPSVGAPGLPGVFTRHRIGDVEIFLVDDRYHRGEDDSVLGAPQTAWLLDALETSDATFRVVGCGSQWTAAGSSDSWAAFLPARDALLAAIRDRGIEGVVLLSGDIHRSEMRLIARGAAGGYDLPELTSSPLANSTSRCPGSSAELRRCYSGESFLTVDLDTAAADPTLTARLRDVGGETLEEWVVRRSELSLP